MRKFNKGSVFWIFLTALFVFPVRAELPGEEEIFSEIEKLRTLKQEDPHTYQEIIHVKRERLKEKLRTMREGEEDPGQFKQWIEKYRQLSERLQHDREGFSPGKRSLAPDGGKDRPDFSRHPFLERRGRSRHRMILQAKEEYQEKTKAMDKERDG